jgi:hypothetical protein
MFAATSLPADFIQNTAQSDGNFAKFNTVLQKVWQ